MTTKETILEYFKRLKEKGNWDAFVSEDITFTSFTNPVRQLTGKQTFLQATKRFYSMILSVEIKDLIIDGEKAVALTHYELQPAQENSFESDVAEIFHVKDGKINYFGIYFDTSPYPK